MGVLYEGEHVSCFNYSAGNKSLIDFVNIKKGDTVDICPKINRIIFVIEGDLNFSYGPYVNVHAKKGNIVIHPAYLNCRITGNTDITVLSMLMNTDLSFCDHFSFEKLMEDNVIMSEHQDEHEDSEVPYLHILKANATMELYLKCLVKYLNDGLRCSYLIEMKIKEALFLFRAYYFKEDLAAFFKPILNNDLMFAMKVHDVYDSSLNVQDMANLMNYSLSGFDKKFRKVFATSANKWLQNKKAQSIYHDINCGTKTFSELAYDYHFSSPAHFSAFCRKMFHASPGSIRKRGSVEQ